MHSKYLQVKSNCNIESICAEKNLRKRKWFINGSCNPNKSFMINHLECLKTYQNFLFLGDFKASVDEKYQAEFCNLNGFTSLIKKPTCFKNPDKPTCIILATCKSTKLFSSQ